MGCCQCFDCQDKLMRSDHSGDHPHPEGECWEDSYTEVISTHRQR